MSAFESLRPADRPVTPDRRFADDLRSRITAALVPPVDLPERSEHSALVPYLTVHDAVSAIDWYRTVFDATELVRYVEPDGKVGHCQLLIQGSMVMVSDEYPDFDALSPRTIGGSPIRLNLNVPDVDRVWRIALGQGAVGEREPADQAYGERSCGFVDPFGHRWLVATTIAHPTNAEIQAAMGDSFEIIESLGDD